MRFEPHYVLIIILHYLCYGSEMIHFEFVWMDLEYIILGM